MVKKNVHPIKFLEQLVFKKAVTSHDIAATDPITGQATSANKTRMISGPELLNTFAGRNLTKYIFPELLSARSDDREASMDMHKQIADSGRFSLSKMSTSGIGQVQKTIAYYLYGSGIDNDILSVADVKIDGQTVDIRKN